VCQFAPECERALIVERNGDVYACDHYVYPDYLRGNLQDQPLEAVLDSPGQVRFGRDKLDQLPAACRECDVVEFCHGDCPKHRWAPLDDGGTGAARSVLCPAYRRFFRHIRPSVERMAGLVRSGRLAADILADGKDAMERRHPGRNDACPCGSGRKFKACCGRVTGAAGGAHGHEAELAR